MFETRGKGVSLATKIWAIMLKSEPIEIFLKLMKVLIWSTFFLAIIKLNKPWLYSFQATLPALPVPDLKGTIQRYLRSVRPLCDDAKFQRLTKEAHDFENSIGKRLQRYLVLRSWWATNYVSDWWEEYVYLRSRSPLMIKSNYHTFDDFWIPSHIQSARAAGVVYEMLRCRARIEDETKEPIMVQGIAPLCSDQYKRMFNTARVPGIECDKIVHYEDIKHMIVLNNDCYYKVIIQQGKRLLNPREIQHQLDNILNRKDASTHGEKYLGSLTAWDRVNWAKTRDRHFSTGVNRISLRLIESAAMFLVLHDKPHEHDLKDHGSEKAQYYGRQGIHGNIYNRWFDKSFQLIIGTNGYVSIFCEILAIEHWSQIESFFKYAINAEHAWGDALVVGNMVEEMHIDELKQ